MQPGKRHPPGEPPLFVINADAPTDRQRYTLGHEIGHVACVPAAGQDAEEMAQAFSAELLAPAHQVRADLKAAPVTPARLLQLKAVWQVSAAALLRRAVDLAVISDSRYRGINAQISALGWRTGEPEPLPAERTSQRRLSFTSRFTASAQVTLVPGASVIMKFDATRST